MPVWELLVVLLLIVLNGFFAMSELAVVSAPRVRLLQMADSGSRGARAALRLLDDPTSFLSTVQIGITLIGVLAGAYSGATLAAPLARVLVDLPVVGGTSAYTVALTVVVVAITYLSLVAGELVPKRIALNHAEGIAARVAPIMAVIARVGAPLVGLLRLSTEALLRLLRVTPSRAPAVTEEEIRSLIAEGTEAGVFHAAERDIIDGVLRLADRPVRSVMTPRPDVVWLNPNDPPEVARRKIRESGHSRFPVGRRRMDDVQGVAHAKDVLDAIAAVAAAGGERFDLRPCIRQPLIVHDGTPVLRLLELFRRNPVDMAIVVDEYGSFEGVVTPTDILTAIADDLPEHATGVEEPDAVRRDDGSWLLDGMVGLDDAERLLNRRGMNDGHDYHTLAGFVLWRLGHVPAVAEHFEWNGLRFEVMDMDGRRIDHVLVSELRVGRAVLDQRRLAEHDGERIVQLVGDARQQHAERGELLALVECRALTLQLALRVRLVGDVGEGAHDRAVQQLLAGDLHQPVVGERVPVGLALEVTVRLQAPLDDGLVVEARLARRGGTGRA